MTDFSKIARQMREDWNRRIAHDYRFWMTESHADDASMWASGKRDVEILVGDIRGTQDLTVLEIGCGVGRIMKALAQRFKYAIGFDISETGIEKAREFLSEFPNAELRVGDGYSLQPVEDKSVDVVISFAAITSMPIDIAASYLLDAHRVLKPGGTLRMQLYLGQEQLVTKNDTLHLRCYKRENFIDAATAAGFELESVNELVLPIPVSFKEIGIEAVIVSLRKGDNATDSAADISQKLLPSGEMEAAEDTGREVECWVSLNYAKQLAEDGDIDRAREALDYALAFAKTTTIDVRDLLDRVVATIEKNSNSSLAAATKSLVGTPALSDIYAKNLEALEEKFPQVAVQLKNLDVKNSDLKTHDSNDGPVVYAGGTCLDHPQKPKAAAVAWCKRLLEEERIRKCDEVVIFGFAFAYHIEELLAQKRLKVSAIEPNAYVFKLAMQSRDLSSCIRQMENLSVGNEEKVTWLSGNSELVMRPQTQSLHADRSAKVKSAFYGKRGLKVLKPSVAILGPMQGGTLPIMGYCLRGMLSLGQRTRCLDMSGFAGAYHQLEGMVFDKARQSTVQGNYVEMMSQVILEAVTEKPVDMVICMAQAPITGRVLSELRKRGIITVLWFVEDYLRFSYWKDMAQYYDFVFTIQRGDCISAIKAAGAGEVHYLPVGCDPIIHTPVQLSAEEKHRWGSEISFVGAGYHNRQQLLATLCDYPFKIWGTEWPDCKPFDGMVQEGGRRLTPEEYVKIFSATDINLNLHSSSERDGVDPYGDFVNPRTFELAAAGAFQLCDERILLPEVFEPGREIITFKDGNDLKQKIDYFREHKEEREKIAQLARQKALNEHTYVHRLNEMLKIIYASKYEMLHERNEKSPWKKMIARSAMHPELLKRCEDAYQRGEEPILDGLVADVLAGKGKLSETEQKLLFLFHIRKQIIRMNAEEGK